MKRIEFEYELIELTKKYLDLKIENYNAVTALNVYCAMDEPVKVSVEMVNGKQREIEMATDEEEPVTWKERIEC